MNEDINILEQNIQFFFNSKNNNLKNSEFKAYFYQGDENKQNISVIYDNHNYIYYLLNIPENKKEIIKEKNEYEITITDSSYDILLYKSSTMNNSISCLLILIINDIDIKLTNENYLEFKEEKLNNINYNEKIINEIKETILYNLKNEKEMIDGNISIQQILMEEKDTTFIFNKNLIETENINIKNQIEKLSKLISKVEIKNDNCDINNLFMNTYEILSPSYKSTLIQKYINEMPNNLYYLMQKYKEANITKNNYEEYKNKKINIEKKSKNEINYINISKDKKIKKKNHNIFKLKILKNRKKKDKINNKQKIIKIENKKSIFKINKDNQENKEENKKDYENLNKMEIEGTEKIIHKKKNIFKCISIKKKKKNIFAVNRK